MQWLPIILGKAPQENISSSMKACGTANKPFRIYRKQNKKSEILMGSFWLLFWLEFGFPLSYGLQKNGECSMMKA